MRVHRSVLFLCLGLMVVACSDEAENGRIRLLLADAPFPTDMIDAAEIVVSSVAVHTQGDEDGWHSFPIDPTPMNLLSLQNGVTLELADAEIPVGRINQIRLVVEEGEVELSDGRIFELVVPSGAASGLKIFPEPPIEVVSDLTTEILLDFDVTRSFRAIPSSPQRVEDIESFQFHPVLRVANLTTTGSISGAVLSTQETPDHADDLPLFGATVMATTVDDTATTLTDENGLYKMMGLDAGTWKVRASLMDFLPDSTFVDVVSGNEAVADSLRLEGVLTTP